MRLNLFTRKKSVKPATPAIASQPGEEEVAELLKKVRELEIKSKKITTHLFTGEYHSAFKGKGMSFREVREYSAGDDPRFIDWNVSARFSHPFTKLFEEERELTMMLLVDTSTSNLFGTTGKRKKDLVTEIASVLCFSAISNNDKVGAVFFSDRVEKYIAPKKGRQHALYIVRQLLSMEPATNSTHIGEAIRYFNNTSHQRSIAFVLSDFLDEGYENDLRVIGRKHDVIGIKVYDPMDMTLPDAGLLQLRDPESGRYMTIDSSDPWVRHRYQQFFLEHSETSQQLFRKSGSDLLHVRTDEDYVKVLQKFFLKRS
jgi:uncharacterized protein (DUF58 family)